jgi:hypothetical protein
LAILNDVVLVATASDLQGRVALDTHRADPRTLLRALPAAKTIFSDLPLEPGRDAYQAILNKRRMSGDRAG